MSLNISFVGFHGSRRFLLNSSALLASFGCLVFLCSWELAEPLTNFFSTLLSVSPLTFCSQVILDSTRFVSTIFWQCRGIAVLVTGFLGLVKISWSLLCSYSRFFLMFLCYNEQLKSILLMFHIIFTKGLPWFGLVFTFKPILFIHLG